MAKRNKKQKSFNILFYIIIFLVFVFMYLITPKVYDSVMDRHYAKAENQLLTALISNKDTQMLITRYAIENNAYVQVQGNNTTYATPTITSVNYDETTHRYQLENGDVMTLKIQYAKHGQMDLNQVLIIVLPTAALILMLLLALIQFLIRKSKKDDFIQFCKITDDMLMFKKDARLPTRSPNNAKNELAENINDLYAQVLNGIEALKTKSTDNIEMENRLIQLVKMNSADIEKSLEEIKVIVGKMILNEKEYRNHQVYLIDVKMKLEALQEKLHQDIQLHEINAIPTPIKIHRYFQKIIKSYELLALEKRIGFRFKLSQDFETTFNDFLFKKAFDEMMQFILMQCQPQTNIVIAQNDYDIIIAYKGDALSPISIETVRSTDIHLKNLFQSIQKMGLYLDFETTQKKDGMQFVFHF